MARYIPSEEKQTEDTKLVWARNFLMILPLEVSHMITEQSKLPEARHWLSHEKANASTEQVWPNKVLSNWLQLHSIMKWSNPDFPKPTLNHMESRL